jgi:putative PIN family toxin of toxin-antitoxin system
VRIVLDTNVLVAGLLSPFGPPGEIVRMVSSGELELCLDARVLSEYGDVLERPKVGFDPDSIGALLDFIEHRAQMVASSPLPAPLPDPDDEPFLEIALACTAECLVTGNLVHYPEGSRQGVQVLSPAEFVQHYRSRMRPDVEG